jgi:hypothetical protein
MKATMVSEILAAAAALAVPPDADVVNQLHTLLASTTTHGGSCAVPTPGTL